MTHKVIDRCKENTSTTGTGNLTLTGAVTGFISMADATYGLTANGDTSWFCAEAGAQWEVFLGTRVSATELSRTLLASSTGATINFSSPPVVFSTVPAVSFPRRIVKAYRGVSNQSITSGVYTKAQLNAEEKDSFGEFDSATNFRWAPTVGGTYQVNFKADISGATLSVGFAALYKNGAIIAFGSYASPVGNEVISSGCEIVSMNGTTDYLELYVYGSGTTVVVRYGADRTSLSGFMLSPAE